MKNSHPAHEEPPPVMRQDEREPDTEEDGEDGVELAVHQQVLQEAYHFVNRCGALLRPYPESRAPCLLCSSFVVVGVKVCHLRS